MIQPLRILIGVHGKVLLENRDGYLTTEGRCIGDLSSWGQSMVTKRYDGAGYCIGLTPMFWDRLETAEWDHIEYFLVEFEWGGSDGYVKTLMMDVDDIVERLLS